MSYSFTKTEFISSLESDNFDVKGYLKKLANKIPHNRGDDILIELSVSEYYKMTSHHQLRDVYQYLKTMLEPYEDFRLSRVNEDDNSEITSFAISPNIIFLVKPKQYTDPNKWRFKVIKSDE